MSTIQEHNNMNSKKLASDINDISACLRSALASRTGPITYHIGRYARILSVPGKIPGSYRGLLNDSLTLALYRESSGRLLVNVELTVDMVASGRRRFVTALFRYVTVSSGEDGSLDLERQQNKCFAVVEWNARLKSWVFPVFGT